MKRSIFKIILGLFLFTAICGCKSTEEEDFGILTEIAGSNGTTYNNLFDVILTDENLKVWKEEVASLVPAEQVDVYVNALTSSISSTKYGEEAVEAVKAGGPAIYDCFYINGAKQITFKGNEIKILKEDGKSETHTYEYLGSGKIGEGEKILFQGQEFDISYDVDIYQTKDEAGEFKYFLMREDTMASTYHIEFRYGSNLENLKKAMSGPYAFWLTAGIDVNADSETIKKVINLFVTENMN